MLGDSDPLVREMTAGALGKLGHPGALPTLRDAAKTEPEDYIQSAIEKAIEALQGR